MACPGSGSGSGSGSGLVLALSVLMTAQLAKATLYKRTTFPLTSPLLQVYSELSGTSAIILFHFKLQNLPNKLECLSLASLSGRAWSLLVRLEYTRVGSFKLFPEGKEGSGPTLWKFFFRNLRIFVISQCILFQPSLREKLEPIEVEHIKEAPL